MTDVLIVSGAGDYSDPWHPFDETTAQLVEILEPVASVVVRTDVAPALAALQGSDADLVVLNLGSAGREVSTDAACVDGLERYLEHGGRLLVLHVAATAFPADPRWEELLGGRWVRGTSMHPPHGDARIEIAAVEHPVIDGLEDFVLSDERYSHLRVSDGVVVLATHVHDEQDHAMVWARERGGARIVYDGLGHDGRSYESPDHRRLVLNAFHWLTSCQPSSGRTAVSAMIDHPDEEEQNMSDPNETSGTPEVDAQGVDADFVTNDHDPEPDDATPGAQQTATDADLADS